MRSSRVLVLGNDPQINEIRFDKLAKDIVTIGVNRIWLKHTPDFYFFHDPEILIELLANDEAVQRLRDRSVIYASDWLIHQATRRGIVVPSWVAVYPRITKAAFPDSVTTAIHLFVRNFPTSVIRTFYIAGVSLKWQTPSHFWKVKPTGVGNTNGPDWYTPRFDKTLENFKRLKRLGSPIVSVNPNSRLNSSFRYEGIENLYFRARP